MPRGIAVLIHAARCGLYDTLYAAPTMSHHKVPGYQFIKVLANRKSCQFEDLQDCLGMYNKEQQFPDETYQWDIGLT